MWCVLRCGFVDKDYLFQPSGCALSAREHGIAVIQCLRMLSWVQRFRRDGRKKNIGSYRVPTLRTYAHTGQDRCVGCGLCAEVCPVEAVRVESSSNKDNTVSVDAFLLDMEACVQCGLCVEACPTQALEFVHTHKAVKRQVYTKKDLLNGGAS